MGGGGESKWKLVLIFAAVTRYTPLRGSAYARVALSSAKSGKNLKMEKN